MSTDQLRLSLAHRAAEDILHLIYGDDLNGCAVPVDSIADVVLAALAEDAESKAGILDAHEKTMEALLALSTPPQAGKVSTPNELHSLLSERLDTINQLARKLIALTATAMGQT
jgi:hypothetical protein